MSTHKSSSALSRRSGATLLECVLAISIVGVGLALAAQGIALVVNQRRICQRREMALLELDGVLERVALLPWNDLTRETVEKFEISPGFHELAPQARLSAIVADESGKSAGKRVTVALHWQSAGGEEQGPSLTAWRQRAQEATP